MQSRLVAELLLLSLLCSALAACFSGSLVYAASSPRITILADGTIDGTTSIQRSGNIYTLSESLTLPLYVERDNIIVDGAGYAVDSEENRGVVLEQRQNVTVKNLVVFLDGGYLLDLRSASNCKIIDNVLVGTPKPLSIPGLPEPSEPVRLIGPLGMNLLYSTNNHIENNSITKSFYAISLSSSQDNTVIQNRFYDSIVGIDIDRSNGNFLSGNQAINCEQGIGVRLYSGHDYNNTVDSTNTINGKPVYYWLNHADKTVPSNASYVVLVNCTRIQVQDVDSQGVILILSQNCTVSNSIFIERADGVRLLNSSENTVTNCTIKDQAIGIQLDGSHDNLVTGCTVSNCTTRGINLAGSNNNVFSNNSISDCNSAMSNSGDDASNNNLILANLFADNGNTISVRGALKIQNNTFIRNQQAILCASGSNNITGNVFSANGQAVTFQSTNNILTDNQFLGNNESLSISSDYFANNVDSSNTIDAKPVCYWVNQHNQTVPSNAGFVALVNCSQITVKNLNLANQTRGITLAFTQNSTITNNLIANNTNAIYLYGAPNNNFTANNVTNNGYAVYISGGKITFLGGPMTYTPSSGNLFYRNNFVGNSQLLYDLAGAYDVGSSPSANLWDNGEEGNYWSSYTGEDADGNGIGDSRFVVYANNSDYYPLMQPVTVTIPELPFGAILLFAAAFTIAALVAKKKLQFKTQGGKFP
ncbi:MAG: right-handed parallel beta-helix repeat-containing protein [Candidatus Bathyarchaeota archaeon]|nr:right-handed parallel beta-helix repeat-containing protein [Candidatus Bathyarchaeota archaeon]